MAEQCDEGYPSKHSPDDVTIKKSPPEIQKGSIFQGNQEATDPIPTDTLPTPKPSECADPPHLEEEETEFPEVEHSPTPSDGFWTETEINEIFLAIGKLRDDLRLLQSQYERIERLGQNARRWDAAATFVEEQKRTKNRRVTSELANAQRVSEVWTHHAPLAARIQFLAALLGPRHEYHTVLSKSEQLAKWLTNAQDQQIDYIRAYPALFADLVHPTRQPLVPPSRNVVEELVEETLKGLQDELEARLQAISVELIEPQVGRPVTSECEVVENLASTEIPEGCIAQVKRLGLRLYGGHHLSAQVVRAVAPQPQAVAPTPEDAQLAATSYSPPICEETETTTPPLPATSQGPLASADETPAQAPPLPDDAPDWYKELFRLSVEPGNEILQDAFPELLTAIEGMQTASDPEVIREHLNLFLDWLSPTNRLGDLEVSADLQQLLYPIQDSVRDWLRTDLGITLLRPRDHEPFDQITMHRVGERLTMSQRYDNQVAFVKRIGARRDERVIAKAHVDVFRLGGASR